MIEMFQSGEAVPRDWFKRLDNVESIIFLHPCVVETMDEQRTIRKAAPILDTPMVLFSHFEGSDGVMNVIWDRPTVVYL